MRALYDFPFPIFLLICIILFVIMAYVLFLIRNAKMFSPKLAVIIAMAGPVLLVAMRIMEEKSIIVKDGNLLTIISCIYVALLLVVAFYSANKHAETEQAKAYLKATYVFIIIAAVAFLVAVFAYFMSRLG